MTYKVLFSPKALRDLKSLAKPLQQQLINKANELGRNPRPMGVEKLTGEDKLHRIRMGDYRIVYEIQDKELVVLVIQLGHRREIYR